jgi:iron complex outermembrane receptor protein
VVITARLSEQRGGRDVLLLLLIFIFNEIPVIEVEGEFKKELPLHIISPSFNDDSLSDALSKEAGVTIRRYGAEGSFSLITIRGGSPSHTEFFLEGVPISLTPYSAVNVEDLPLQGIGRIEVAKDFIPSRFSTASIGGIINITLPDKGKPSFHYFRGEISSFKTLRTMGYSIRNFLSHACFFYLDLFHTDGDFEYRNSNGTPFNPYDDYSSKRKNNHTNRVEFLGKYSYHPSGAISDISITANLFSKEQGIAGTDFLQAEKAGLKTERIFLVGEMKMEREKLSLSFQPFTGAQYETFSDPEGEVGLQKEEVKQEFLSWGMRVNSSINNFKKFQPSLSILYSGSRWESQWKKPSSFSFPSLRNEMRFSSDSGFSVSERIFLIPQVVFYLSRTEGKGGILYYGEKDISSTHFSIMPSLSGILKFSSHSLTINAGRYVRIPSFFELMGDRGVWMGNPDLKPEEGIKGSIDWKGDFRKFSSSSGFFVRSLKNLISYTQNSQFTFIAENISRALIIGFEGSISANFSPLETGLNYTYLYTEDRGKISYLKGKKLPLQPSHELHYFLNLDFPKNFSFRYEFDLRGETFLDRANMRKIGLKTEHSVYLTKRITKGVRIHGYIENIVDERQVDIYSIPLPGRRLGVKVEGEIM